MAERAILEHLDLKGDIPDSSEFASTLGFDHNEIVNIIKSLHGFRLVDAVEIKKDKYVLTDEGESYTVLGSPEVQVFLAVPPEGISTDELKKKVSCYKIGSMYARTNGWLDLGKQVTRKAQHVEDHVKDLLLQLKDGKVCNCVSHIVIYIDYCICLTWTVYSLKKGPEFALERRRLVTDLTREHLQSGDWEKQEFKGYNFNAKNLTLEGGHLHPLLKARWKCILNNSVSPCSFWNFDALFQPQQHPARDSHDTFFLRDPASTKSLPEDYVERVKRVHESGGYGSKGYGYDWKREEADKNVLRTHTTAVSARMLYKLAQQPFSPRRYFSIDRVFRNEAVDRTHLAEFHQIEGVVCDRGLTLGDLMGVLHDFFMRLGMSKLRFKPTYNPYTEPSMEIYSYHEGFKKWVEVGNSGMFRPEMLLPMGLPEDVTAIAWGLSLERPTMILYGIDNIRDLFGPKVDLGLIKRNPICRLGIQ
ncbi:Phenylalanyl-tRNA synthetase [Macleaya cordata]|uniref:phenylalanine--tRNA ligase n=1 Tax=Macleaya cordata TaxID=56857 RepID=A0A200Q500_MACCD|nr:Phenylalanyl-tRNA synthetase [Macleaya cordata]